MLRTAHIQMVAAVVMPVTWHASARTAGRFSHPAAWMCSQTTRLPLQNYPPTVTLTGLLHWPTRESPTR